MYIINPDPYLLPTYRISPFRTVDVKNNLNLPNDISIREYFNGRFGKNKYTYTSNGREAINLALSTFKLSKNDIVSILTTSGNFYISSCVIHEIEKYCKWSREILPETKVLFVNHEFGYPYENLGELREYGLPIVEDCAGSFFSHDVKNETGNIGDFVIYSFPKMFPLQIGGLLVSNKPGAIDNKEYLSKDKIRYVENVLSSQIDLRENIISKRIENYDLLGEKFRKIGFKERFPLVDGIVPGVFMFSTEGYKLDLPELKKHFNAHGIQCSVFYGEESFFLPCHQNLEPEDIMYFYNVMNSFLKI